MSVRNLIFVVLSLVAGTAVTVGWYLEGENEVRAEVRALEAPIRHVPRTVPDVPIRPTASWTPRTMQPGQSGSTHARPSNGTPSAWWMDASGADETATALQSGS